MPKMTDEAKRICVDRAQTLLDALSQCNSGADIHKVNSMRHIATQLISICEECEHLEMDDIQPILKRLEKNVTLYFTEKYSHLGFSKHCLHQDDKE